MENRDVTIVKSRNPEHVRDLAAREASNGTTMVVAVGGDGTVNMAAQGLVGSETILGVIPTGSGNGFARNVGIPLRIEKAMALLKEPDIARIDVGSVGDRIFLVTCGIGWEAVIATVFEGSKIRGVLPYATAALSTFLQYEPQQVEITAEPGNWHYSGHPMMLSVANMREFGVNVTISPEANSGDGLLDICMIPRHDLLDVLKYTPEMFRQRTDFIPGYVRRLANKITIHRQIAGNIHVDGSPIPSGEDIAIKLLPSALSIVCRKEILQ